MNATKAPSRIRLAVVGLKFGRHLLRTLTGLPGVEVVAAADRNAGPGVLAEAGMASGIRLYADAGQLLDAESLDGLVIATSPRDRGPLLKACARRRMWVFVEKPWAGNLSQGIDYAALCQPIRDRVMVGFSFRYHPVVQRLRTLVDEHLGPVVMANGEYAFHWDLGAGGWLWDADGGGGIFNENSCHLIDVVCHLTGRPTSVQAVCTNPRGRPSPEFAVANLTFVSGGIATLSLAALSAPAFNDYPRLDLITTRGRAELRGRNHVWETLAWARSTDATVSRLDAPPEALGATRYSSALAHFVDCIRHDLPPTATIADGLRAIEVAAALVTSASLGQRVPLAAAREIGSPSLKPESDQAKPAE
jgi:predicted dehydrogenase